MRSRSARSGAAHAVLRHLEAQDFAGAPRFVDGDDTSEVLSHVPGQSIPSSLEGFRDDDTLNTIARAIRALHLALGEFRPPHGMTFPRMPGAPEGGRFVCHNDLAPWNTIMHGKTFAGFIDWDLVTLASPAWDLAYAAWRFVPLYPDETSFGPVEQRGHRLNLFLDAYGLADEERSGFVDLVRRRQCSAYETVEQWGREGRAGFDRLFEQRLHVGALDDVAWIDSHGDELRRAILR